MSAIIRIPRGDDGSFLVAPIDHDTGQPYDPAGHSARWVLARDGNVVLDRVTADDGIRVEDVDGVAMWAIDLPADVTTTLDLGGYTHEFKAREPGGRIRQLFRAGVSVTESEIGADVPPA